MSENIIKSYLDTLSVIELLPECCHSKCSVVIEITIRNVDKVFEYSTYS